LFTNAAGGGKQQGKNRVGHRARGKIKRVPRIPAGGSSKNRGFEGGTSLRSCLRQENGSSPQHFEKPAGRGEN